MSIHCSENRTNRLRSVSRLARASGTPTPPARSTRGGGVCEDSRDRERRCGRTWLANSRCRVAGVDCAGGARVAVPEAAVDEDCLAEPRKTRCRAGREDRGGGGGSGSRARGRVGGRSARASCRRSSPPHDAAAFSWRELVGHRAAALCSCFDSRFSLRSSNTGVSMWRSIHSMTGTQTASPKPKSA